MLAFKKHDKAKIIFLLKFISPIAISLGVNDILAHALGFESLGDYMEEDYNKSNPSYLRKMYFIRNVKPNFENMEA